MKLPEISVNRPITIYMFIAVLVILGAISFTRLSVDLMPDVRNPTISVRAEYPGVAPEEMENLVTRPLQASLSAAPGIYRINSSSAEGSSNIRIERVPGVAALDIRGGLRREIHVALSIEKLRSYNLSVNQIVDVIRRENQNRPVGPMEEGKYEVLLRTQGEFQDVEQINNVVVAARNGAPIYLKRHCTGLRHARRDSPDRADRRQTGGAFFDPQTIGGDHRHFSAHVQLRVHAQHDVVRSAGAGRGDDCRQCDSHHREHFPTP